MGVRAASDWKDPVSLTKLLSDAVAMGVRAASDWKNTWSQRTGTAAPSQWVYGRRAIGRRRVDNSPRQPAWSQWVYGRRAIGRSGIGGTCHLLTASQWVYGRRAIGRSASRSHSVWRPSRNGCTGGERLEDRGLHRPPGRGCKSQWVYGRRAIGRNRESGRGLPSSRVAMGVRAPSDWKRDRLPVDLPPAASRNGCTGGERLEGILLYHRPMHAERSRNGCPGAERLEASEMPDPVFRGRPTSQWVYGRRAIGSVPGGYPPDVVE